MERMIGYARSEINSWRNLDDQISLLNSAGCQEVFTDSGVSGNTLSRPGIRSAMRALQKGDTLIICQVECISPLTSLNMQIIDDLMYRSIELRSLGDPLNAQALIHKVNYAPPPTFKSAPLRFIVHALGRFLLRRSWLKYSYRR